MKYWTMLLALAVFTQAHAGDDARRVLDCMRANVPSAAQVEDIQLSSSDSTGTTRALSGKIYAQRKGTHGSGELQVALRIESPTPYAGAAYLIREPGAGRQSSMFVYLPSVGRVRRITGAFVDGSLMGTNFSYQDFRQLATAFAGSTATLEPPSTIEQRPVYVLSFRPAAGSHSSFDRVRAWVDQKTCVPLKASFYAGNALLKALTASADALRQSGKYWYLSEMTMSDLRSGSQTVLRVAHVGEGVGIDKHYFEPGSFYQAN
ncbi:MAG TPA: outer membrane lipoprotein-sorting protein [Stenotrophobium sp.]|nr:outer membrane lipoprotein-sorting protein [Stenotrophobium sp.]